MAGFLEAHENNLPYFEKTNYQYKLFNFLEGYSEIQLVYCPELFPQWVSTRFCFSHIQKNLCKTENWFLRPIIA